MTMNVDAQEIDKFSQLASRWWDPEGEFKPLHQINPLRLDFVQQHCNGLFGKRVCDVGCGGGILAESMAALGADVSAIDMAEASLEVAKLHGLESGYKVDYHLSTAEAFADANAEQFDVVTCMEMLEHVPDPSAVIDACSRLVKPGGQVFFSTINRNLKAWLMAIVGAEYVLGLVPKGTHQHDRFIKPAELIASAEDCELFTRHAVGLHLHPISRQFYLSDSNVDVNYILHTERAE